jgi:multidrug resistance efflux pump
MSDKSDNHAPSGNSTTAAGRPSLALSDRVRSLRMPAQSHVKGGGSWFPWILCLLLAAAGGFVGYKYYLLQQVVEAEARDKESTPETSNTGSSALIAKSGEVAHESKGYIIPVHQIQVSPKVSGQIIKLHFKEGDVVKQGTVLAEFEDINYRADRDRAVAQLDEARRNLDVLTKYRQREIDQVKAKLDEAKAQLVQLESDRQRSLRLRQTATLAEGDFEKADSAFQAQKQRVAQLEIDLELLKKGPRDINIQAAEARIQMAQSDVVRTQWYLDNCKIIAPITGTILSKIAEEGNIVNQLSFNLKGSLCDMADLSDIEVDLTIQERDVAKVFKGQRCKIRSEAFPDRVYDGVVSRLMPTGDRAKGAVPVRVKVEVSPEEQGTYLKPEMGVNVSFYKGDNPNKKK